jgi:ATP-dependent Lhr-like helicase
MPMNRKVQLDDLIESVSADTVRKDLKAALDGTDLLKRYFRINATRSFMILKRYKGHEKSAAQQQVSSEMLLSFADDLDSFAVIEETYREILEDKLHIAAIENFVSSVSDGTAHVETYQVSTPSPRAFGLATLAASEVVLAEDENAVLREFHRRVTESIDKSA